MKKPREIPADTFRHWGKCFQDGTLEDEFAPELAHLLFLMAADVEFQFRVERGGLLFFLCVD